MLFLHFYDFLLITSLFKVAPRVNEEVLSGVAKFYKHRVPYGEEHVLDELRPSISSAVGHEFKVNKSTVYAK